MVGGVKKTYRDDYPWGRETFKKGEKIAFDDLERLSVFNDSEHKCSCQRQREPFIEFDTILIMILGGLLLYLL